MVLSLVLARVLAGAGFLGVRCLSLFEDLTEVVSLDELLLDDLLWACKSVKRKMTVNKKDN